MKVEKLVKVSEEASPTGIRIKLSDTPKIRDIKDKVLKCCSSNEGTVQGTVELCKY